MAQGSENQKGDKPVLTTQEIAFISGDQQQKYEALLNAPLPDDTDKATWKAAFDEFSDFYNSALCGYHAIDDTGLIIDMNQTEFDWLGYKKEEIIDRKNIMDTILPDQAVTNSFALVIAASLGCSPPIILAMAITRSSGWSTFTLVDRR
jgi:PAS domain-containing protein